MKLYSLAQLTAFVSHAMFVALLFAPIQVLTSSSHPAGVFSWQNIFIQGSGFLTSSANSGTLSTPYGLNIAGNRLVIKSYGNNRLLIFNTGGSKESTMTSCRGRSTRYDSYFKRVNCR